MIALLTDYGQNGPYVGQLHAVIHQHVPDVPVVDLIHSLPRFDIRSAAYLLPAYTSFLPRGTIIVCVVDPGVGGERPHAIVEADGRFYVGPDNGVFDVLMQQIPDSAIYHLEWPASASETFHGRDIYAPAAATLHLNQGLDGLDCKRAVDRQPQLPSDAAEVVYIDAFGNAITALRASGMEPEARLRIAGNDLYRARKFCDVPVGTCFWYVNANGLVEIAANQDSAAALLGLRIGHHFTITPA